jgi:hypothetical protein
MKTTKLPTTTNLLSQMVESIATKYVDEKYLAPISQKTVTKYSFRNHPLRISRLPRTS